MYWSFSLILATVHAKTWAKFESIFSSNNLEVVRQYQCVQKFYIVYWFGHILATVQGKNKAFFIHLTVLFQKFWGNVKGVQKFYIFRWYALILTTVRGRTKLLFFIYFNCNISKVFGRYQKRTKHLYVCLYSLFLATVRVEPGSYFSFILIVTFRKFFDNRLEHERTNIICPLTQADPINFFL